MLLAHPVIMRNLVERYEALSVLHAGSGAPTARRELDDVAYLLCIATGTSDVDAALIAAACDLPGARTADDSVIGDQLPAGRPRCEPARGAGGS
ncbi:DUF5133 domain-containing protein [Streptomyces sp. NBC_00344]|uniref:DUF5133 domain-containing protein n=1 Tax=Streptomyces sp. NBC_00344 TaxID=2975720 RepID=UPI002E1EAEAA